MTDHTPGPWRTQIDDKGDLLLIAGQGHIYWLGNVEDTCGECHANARLMASAPDLLEACEAAEAWMQDYYQHASVTFGGEAEVGEKLQAAIRKAKGEGDV